MHRSTFILGMLSLGVLAFCCCSGAQDGTGKPQTNVPAVTPTANAAAKVVLANPEEASIRANVDAYVKAYNAHDPKAIVALFAEEATVVDEEGEAMTGRAALEARFTSLFEEEPQTKIEIDVRSVLFVGTDLAVEVGATKSTSLPGESPDYGKYTALHVKRDGKWLVAAVRDSDGDFATNHEHLLPLEWLVGEWVDESPESVVSTSCRWSPDKNFLLQDIKVQVAGKSTMDVTQRIGWDPLTKRIRSWVFDSEGGFGEGVWARDDNNWIIKSTGVRSDGATASATNTLTRVGKDGYIWRSTDRVIGDEVQPPMEVRVTRKPPMPGTK